LVADSIVNTPIATHTDGPKPACIAKWIITIPMPTSTAAIQRRWWRQ
jgi:hypothetical protein